jgi:hypothetical protein
MAFCTYAFLGGHELAGDTLTYNSALEDIRGPRVWLS